jgi:hypothetical protein
MPRRDPAKAVQVLDLLLGFFGDHGEHWLQHQLGDGTGNRYLVGARSLMYDAAAINIPRTIHVILGWRRARKAGSRAVVDGKKPQRRGK